MMDPAAKKKRFEGLIQFKEPLRQALACIHAANSRRFATSLQSDFVKHRNTPELSHFLLGSDDSAIEDMSNGISPRHTLLAIEQLGEAPLLWKRSRPEPDVKIFAWLNSADHLACQQLYLLLAAALGDHKTLDLNDLSVSGTIKTVFTQAKDRSWMGSERTQLFTEFEKDTAKIFKAQKTTVRTDGCTVSILVEGHTNLSQEQASDLAISHLKNPSRHLVIVNYLGGPKPRLQCVYFTPMCLPLKEVQATAIQGFVVLRDIKTPAKVRKTMLASLSKLGKT